MDWLSIIPALLSAAGTIKQIVDVASSNAEIVDKIKQTLPKVAGLLETYGSQLFPKAKAQLHIAAAAMTAFDPNVTKWIQGACNSLLEPSPNLVVDGAYGPLTRAAVEKLQQKLGLTVDGWAGQLTQAAISSALAALTEKKANG